MIFQRVNFLVILLTLWVLLKGRQNCQNTTMLRNECTHTFLYVFGYYGKYTLGLLLILISKSWGGGGGGFLHSCLLVSCVYVCVLEVAWIGTSWAYLLVIVVRDLGYSLQHWDQFSIGKFLLGWSLNLAKDKKPFIHCPQWCALIEISKSDFKVYLDSIFEPYSCFADVREHANREQNNEGNAVATTDLEDVLYYIKEIQAAFFFFRSKFVPWRFARWLP